MVSVKRCIFQNKETKKYKWLSLEGEGNSRFLLESKIDSMDEPSKPSDHLPGNQGSLPDYENAKQRILDSGYDIVSEL